jgi:hypothetical protein
VSALGTSQQARVRNGRRIPALHIVIAVLIALLLLFLWMHFLLAMQIEATGREIQEEMVVLDRFERQNAALGRKIAESSSQEVLVRRVQEMGYELKTPHYLSLARPLLEPSNGSSDLGTGRLASSGDAETPSPGALSLLDVVADAFSTP